MTYQNLATLLVRFAALAFLLVQGGGLLMVAFVLRRGGMPGNMGGSFFLTPLVYVALAVLVLYFSKPIGRLIARDL